MSGPSHEHTHNHGHGTHDHSHGDHSHGGHGHGSEPHSTMSGYMTGFLLSVVLTAIPFWLVMGHVLPDPRLTVAVVMGLGAIQIVVHMIYFLHMNARSEGGWTLLALIFTVILVAIALTGSLWVMYHLDTAMMPMSVHDMRNMP